MFWLIALAVVLVAVVALVVRDLSQKHHAILRIFPIIGHFRYWLETIGPELRQYIVTDNDQERPFSRDQRRWVYSSSKGENNYFGFGTDNDIEHPKNYLIIKPVAFPAQADPREIGMADPTWLLPCAKVLGGARGRAKAFRPDSIVNISGMSFGSLSGAAVEALNRGADIAGCWQNTGEGGLTPYHQHGGDLVWQIGTGYFGCRDDNGAFSLDQVLEQVAANPVRAIELKLSQGAKPGVGGMLPGAKVTPEIAAIRGVPVGQTCVSPAAHTAFHDVDSLLEFVEMLAEATGLPVGIKSAVGDEHFWHDLALRMDRTGRGVDFITVDGGEGGTGAAPLVFSDHVALPFKWAFSRVYRAFAERGLHERVVFAGSAKLGMPENALLAMSLGCDLIGVGREAMMAIGCIQAQRCHTGRCPTGVATQSDWRQRGLDPALKSVRCANYVATLRMELRRLARTCGVEHPALVAPEAIEVLQDEFTASSLREVFEYLPGWGLPSIADQDEIRRLMAAA